MSTARKAPPRYGLATDPGQPALVQAAGLALTVLRAAKVGAWSELICPDTGAVVIPYEIALTDRQLAMLHEHQHLLAMVQRSMQAATDESGTETRAATRLVTFAVCPDCDRWILMSSGSAPARCTMTVGCPGAPIKASAADRASEPETEADYGPYEALAAGTPAQSVGSPVEDDIEPNAAPAPVRPEPEPDSAAEVSPAYIPEDTSADLGSDVTDQQAVPEVTPDLPDDLEDFD